MPKRRPSAHLALVRSPPRYYQRIAAHLPICAQTLRRARRERAGFPPPYVSFYRSVFVLTSARPPHGLLVFGKYRLHPNGPLSLTIPLPTKTAPDPTPPRQRTNARPTLALYTPGPARGTPIGTLSIAPQPMPAPARFPWTANLR